jgi:4a-hydroxytetrahydrobiopterin dehydratase
MAEPRRLPDEEIQAELKALDEWELRDGRLCKQFTFRTFLRALVFVNSVAYLAESAGHHPDITINYNKVTLRLITHSEGSLTDRDFALAQDIEAKLSTKLIITPENTIQTKSEPLTPETKTLPDVPWSSQVL